MAKTHVAYPTSMPIVISSGVVAIDCSSAYKKAIRTLDDAGPCRSESEGAASGGVDDEIRSPRMA
jgi:hypothetical protein